MPNGRTGGRPLRWGSNAQKYIIETVGTGLALIDYDADGYADLFAVTASKLEGLAKGQEPTNHVYPP